MCPIIWPRDNVLGPVLLLWYLVVSLSYGQEKMRRKSLPTSDTQNLLSPLLSFCPINQSPFVPAFVHTAVYDYMTKALPLRNSSFRNSSFSLRLFVSVYLSISLSSQPPSSFLCCLTTKTLSPSLQFLPAKLSFSPNLQRTNQVLQIEFPPI